MATQYEKEREIQAILFFFLFFSKFSYYFFVDHFLSSVDSKQSFENVVEKLRMIFASPGTVWMEVNF